MNFTRKQLWHLDPLTGVPVDKTVADFKYTKCVYNAIELFAFSSRRLIASICTDQGKGRSIPWKEWDLNPEKVCTCAYGHSRKIHVLLLATATASR